jgi:hypothetical protein
MQNPEPLESVSTIRICLSSREFSQQQLRNQVAGDHEEEVDADNPACQPWYAIVEADDG